MLSEDKLLEIKVDEIGKCPKCSERTYFRSNEDIWNCLNGGCGYSTSFEKYYLLSNTNTSNI